VITLVVFGVLWTIALLVVGSDAGTDILDVYVFAFGGCGVAICWIMRYLAVTRKRDPSATPRTALVVAIGSAWIVIGAVTTMIDAPHNPLFHARFRASEAALTAEARRLLMAGQEPAKGTHIVGLFRVKQTDVVNGEVRFITTSCGMIDLCGFVYSPSTEPKRLAEDVFSPLHGRWWHLLQGF
jgi:hypothetical protein